MDMDSIIIEFKRHMNVRGYAPKTMASYGYGLTCFTAFVQTKNIDDLRKINHKLIIEYQAHINRQGGAMETRAIKIRAVKRLFEYLTHANRLLINPAEGIIETNRTKRNIGTVLSQQEMNRLLNQPNPSIPSQIRDRAIMEVLYSTGIRSNEMLSVHVYDVDLSDRVLFIRKGKGKRQRVVPMGASAAACLKEYIEKVRPRHARKNPKERTLFLTVTGQPLTWNAIRTKIQDYRKTAGIEKPIGLHVFRRTCATHMMQHGADIRYIQKLLGHKYLKTTQQYTHVMPTDVKATHQKTHPNTKETDDHEH
jgi:integrase/recombinase XerD